MAHARGRSYDDFADLTSVELEVIAAAREGRVARFDDTIPVTPERKLATRVRAGVLRFLMLGGDDAHPVHESGVQIWGAYVLGDLDLSDGTLSHNMELSQCHLAGQLILRGSRTRVISLQGSRCDGVDADGAEMSELYLAAGSAAGVVRLVGATIKGSLECHDARFFEFDGDGDTFICDRSTIGGTVFLRRAFTVGNVRLVGATIKGGLLCEGSQFGCMPAAVAPADWNREVLNLERLTVNGTVRLGNRRLPNHPPARFDGGINLTGAKIGALIDDFTADTVRPDPGGAGGTTPEFLMLDGCTYERFNEPTDLSADARAAFLGLQRENDLRSEFKYRPWTQMTSVLHAAGHETAAKELAIKKQQMLRRAGHTGVMHSLYGLSYGYGYRPWYLAGWAVLFAVLSAVFFSMAAAKGAMAPTDRRVLDDSQYAACRWPWVVHWTKCEPLQSRYTTFNPLLYSIELIVPIAGQLQAKDWAPVLKRPCSKVNMFGFCEKPMPNTPRDPNSSAPLGYWWLGIFATVLARLETVFGWLAGLMFVAVASGLIKKD